jgi:hypothetical protein
LIYTDEQSNAISANQATSEAGRKKWTGREKGGENGQFLFSLVRVVED